MGRECVKKLLDFTSLNTLRRQTTARGEGGGGEGGYIFKMHFISVKWIGRSFSR